MLAEVGTCKMKSIIVLTQCLALMGTVAALSEKQAQQPVQNIVTHVEGSKNPLSEAEVFNRPARPEVKSTTPEQKAAAEKKMQEIEKHRAAQPKKKNRHPDLVLHKHGPLTKAEQVQLTLARSAAIEDSKAHQVHADESKLLTLKL
jgi:hypothetical protein